MRTVLGVVIGGAVVGAVIGVLVHFSSYRGRSGVFIGDDAGRLFQRPPWTDLFAWAGVGVVLALVVATVLRLLGFTLVRRR